jgi:hypothetical protein
MESAAQANVAALDLAADLQLACLHPQVDLHDAVDESDGI